EQRWAELESADAARAFRAMGELIVTADLAVPLLARELRPVAGNDPARLGRIAGWIDDLDHNEFNRRETASRELAREMEDAELLLQKALEKGPSAEGRTRARALLKEWEETKELKRIRAVRALEALERIDNAASRSLLDALARGA